MVESRVGAPDRPGIRESLAGRRILVTGVTGFLGAALLERLLTDVPTCQLVLLVRSRFGSSPEARVKELLGRQAFDRFREENGGADAIDRAMRERIAIVEGDVLDEVVPSMPAP